MNTTFELILYFIPVLIGLYFFYFKKSPLYFRLLFFAVSCYLLEVLYNIVWYVCIGTHLDHFSFAAFASGACFAFMLSANYGQFDSFVDDGTKELRSARYIGLLAPLGLIVIYVFTVVYALKQDYQTIYLVLAFICRLPAFFAAYFHLKHLVLPDKMHFLVDSLRPCNLMCIIFLYADFIYDLARALNAETLVNAMIIVIPLCLIGMMITAERGSRKWKI